MKVLLLTGCAGFIGLNFLRELQNRKSYLGQYHKIISIDKMGYASTFNRSEYYKVCKELDIKCIDKSVNNLQDHSSSNFIKELSDYEWDIVDLASESHVDNSINTPSAIFKQNAEIPAVLIDWITQNDIKKNLSKIKRYIHITTDETLGDLELGTPYSGWFDENSPMLPNNPYSASKAAQDCYLRSIQKTFGLNLQFIRLSNQFGPWQHSEKMLPITIMRAIKGQSIKVYGTGKNIRQWCPVTISTKIMADVLFNIIDDKAFVNGIIQLAKLQELMDNNTVVEIWRKILHKKGFESRVEYVEDRKGHDLMYALQTNTIVDDYFHACSLEEEFEKTIDFYIENQNLYLGRNV